MPETPEKELGPAGIIAAYNEYINARASLYGATEQELEAKEALRKRENELLLSGAIIGKNTEARAAEIRNGSKTELEAVENARAQKAHALLQFDIAGMNLDCIKTLIRYGELVHKQITVDV